LQFIALVASSSKRTAATQSVKSSGVGYFSKLFIKVILFGAAAHI